MEKVTKQMMLEITKTEKIIGILMFGFSMYIKKTEHYKLRRKQEIISLLFWIIFYPICTDYMMTVIFFLSDIVSSIQ